MVEKHVPTAAAVTKKPKNRDGNNDKAPANAMNGLSNDPVLTGLGTILGGLVANRIAAAKNDNKSPEACPIQ